MFTVTQEKSMSQTASYLYSHIIFMNNLQLKVFKTALSTALRVEKRFPEHDNYHSTLI